jgi:hypothetical protein
MAKVRSTPNFLAVAGIVLVLGGLLAGIVAPFVGDGREFAFAFGRAVAFAVVAWISVRLIGYFTDPNRVKPPEPPDSDPR